MGRSTEFRRAAIVALGAPLFFGVLAAGPLVAAADEASPAFAGAAAAQMRFRAIRVDVSPLAGNGLGPEAAWMEQDLPARLMAAFAGRVTPGDPRAPTLVVRIDGMQLGQSGVGGTQPFDGSAARDNIEGAGLVVAPNGKVVATYPLFSTQLAFTGGSVYEVGTERRRVGELASSFAQWLPGRMGL